MWTMTQDGFFSTVASDRDPDKFLVRTRALDDVLFLQAWILREHGVDVEVTVKEKSDYPWRLIIDRELWGSYLVYATEQLDYTNFKDRIHEVNEPRAQVYTQVWWNLLKVEDEDKLPAEMPTAYRSLDQLLGFDDELEGARARSIHDLTDAEWQELMEETPGYWVPPSPPPQRKRRRGGKKASKR